MMLLRLQIKLIKWILGFWLREENSKNIVGAQSKTHQLNLRTSSRPGARFSKVPKSFRARKAICEIANRLFWKSDLLTCFQGNKNKNNCEVWRIKCSPFLSYKGNCDTRKWPVKFRDFWETAPRNRTQATVMEGECSHLHRDSRGPIFLLTSSEHVFV